MPTNEPHKSHKMSEWEDTVVCISTTPRFGKFRKCINCEAEHAKTAAGEAMHNELRLPCPEASGYTLMKVLVRYDDGSTEVVEGESWLEVVRKVACHAVSLSIIN